MVEWNEVIGWITAGVVALGIAWAPVACTMSSNAKIEAAIQRGADPIKARCAFAGSTDTAACAVAAAKGDGHE